MLLIALIAVPQPILAAQARQDASAMPGWWPGTPEQIAARAQIEALGAEYYYRIDHGEAESAADLFIPDGVFHPGGSPPLAGREAIRAYYAARSRTIVTRHVSTNLRLTYLDADHAEAVRVITHYLREGVDGSAASSANPSVMEYRESLVRGEDGLWRYASRVATALFSRAR